jgi:hypothetical protein
MRKLLPLFGVRDFGQLGGYALMATGGIKATVKKGRFTPLTAFRKTPDATRCRHRCRHGPLFVRNPAKPPDAIGVISGVYRSYQRGFLGTGHRCYHRCLSGLSPGFSPWFIPFTAPFLLARAKPPELSATFFANCACVRVIPGPGHAGTVSEASATPPTPPHCRAAANVSIC